MKKYFVIPGLLLFMILVYSCSSSTEPHYSLDYFPMKMGNTWYYTGFLHNPDNHQGKKESKWEVTGEKVFGNVKYTEITETNLVRDDIPERKEYYYMSRNKLFKYDQDKKMAGLFAQFDLDKDESFQYFDYNVKVTEKTDSTIRFYYDHPGYIDEEHWITFEKGTGIKSHFSVWGIGSIVVEKIIK